MIAKVYEGVYRCPCGGIILADTEDWAVPLCDVCYSATPECEADWFGREVADHHYLSRMLDGWWSLYREVKNTFMAGVAWQRAQSEKVENEKEKECYS